MRSGLKYALPVLLLILWVGAGCQKTYYTVWEKLGKEKRHLLKDEVEKQRVEQEKASEEFKDALTRIKEIYGLDGGELEHVGGVRLALGVDHVVEVARIPGGPVLR